MSEREAVCGNCGFGNYAGRVIRLNGKMCAQCGREFRADGYFQPQNQEYALRQAYLHGRSEAEGLVAAARYAVRDMQACIDQDGGAHRVEVHALAAALKAWDEKK